MVQLRPRGHGFVVACKTGGPGFDSSSVQVCFLLLGHRKVRKIRIDLMICVVEKVTRKITPSRAIYGQKLVLGQEMVPIPVVHL